MLRGEIAEHLNAEGYRPPKRRERFGAQGITDLLRGLRGREEQLHSSHRDGLSEHEWWLAELAREIPMPPVTLFHWIRRRWVKARMQESPQRRWVVWADEAELERLRERHERPRGYYTRQLWTGESADPLPPSLPLNQAIE